MPDLTAPLPRLAFKPQPGSGDKPDQTPATDLDHGRGRHDIICRSCGTPVTSDSQRTVVMGNHRHVFFNPVGEVFEIGCFSAGCNLAPVGQPTDEFTWFAGYTWQVLLCAGCGAQLGWKYVSNLGGFYGLILPRLAQGPEHGAQ